MNVPTQKLLVSKRQNPFCITAKKVLHYCSPQMPFINIEDRPYSARTFREHDYEIVYASLMTVLSNVWRRLNMLPNNQRAWRFPVIGAAT